MVTIFILLGLGFLCGGIAAIVDGLPYMVLERGFTQVIIGTVAAATGVVLLALSWVLVELKRLRKTLSNAATAISVASMVGGPAPEASAGSSEAAKAAGAVLPGLVGAGALAGAALVATRASATEASEEARPDAGEPDLFDSPPTDAIVPPSGAPGDSSEDAGPTDPDLLPVFDPLRPVDPQGEADQLGRVQAVSAAAGIGADVTPPAFPEPEPRSDQDSEPAHPAALPDEPETELPQPAAAHAADLPESKPSEATPEDEFGALRDSLAELRLSAEPAGGRIEPSFADAHRPMAAADAHETGRADDLAAAESWMEPALSRRAPWFAEETAPAAGEALPSSRAEETEAAPEGLWPKLDISDFDMEGHGPSERGLPQWPPQARQAAPFDENETADEASSAPVHETLDAPETEPPAAEAPAGLDDKAAEAAPSASEEGIVGAYQVGEAHFTIYADGSIQARTPDGDYSFASMEELKVYLASEKSRLGV